ncbi:MAG: type II toxin-antitoxin system RelE/ParE family toxin [Nitrospirales bacterium]|nr:type II toxin-antitoxin system RelE/ParE family toxin [Nitrospirales bacterium]
MPSNKYTVRLLAIAEQDLVELVSYLAAENPTAAADVLDHIEAQLQTLTSYPFIGRIPQASTLTALGYRVLVINNYLVFYKVKGNTVLVHRILHGARDLLLVPSE